MTRLKPGTLVQVRALALEVTSRWYVVNNKTVEDNGYLYIVERTNSDGLVETRSISTGKDAITWLPKELEVNDARGG